MSTTVELIIERYEWALSMKRVRTYWISSKSLSRPPFFSRVRITSVPSADEEAEAVERV